MGVGIHRSGSDLDTEYAVMPGKAVPVNPVVAADFKKANINLVAVFEGGDPIAASKEESKPEI